eukprot:s1120_g8.t3
MWSTRSISSACATLTGRECTESPMFVVKLQQLQELEDLRVQVAAFLAQLPPKDGRLVLDRLLSRLAHGEPLSARKVSDRVDESCEFLAELLAFCQGGDATISEAFGCAGKLEDPVFKCGPEVQRRSGDQNTYIAHFHTGAKPPRRMTDSDTDVRECSLPMHSLLWATAGDGCSDWESEFADKFNEGDRLIKGMADVRKHERSFLRYSWDQRGMAAQDGCNLSLAFSGGGVRAAFFATGVLWRLAECGRLKDVEYISGVSGGTYVATAFASHVVAAERPQGTNIDRWYRELLAAMMLRMQYNTPYLNRDMGQEVADIAPESQEGSGALPRICDLFLLLAVGAGTVLRAPVSISCLFLLPAVQVIEMLYGAEMRAEFCKDVLEPDTEVLSILGKSSAQKQALVLLALLCAAFIVHVCQMFLTRHVRTKMAPGDEESPKDGRASLGIARCYTGLRSSLAVLVRLLAAGLLLDALVVGPVAWRLHRYATVEGGTELRYCQCAAFFEHKSCDHCGEVALTSHNTTRWRERWVSLNCSALTAARLTGPTPQVSREAVAADWLIHRPLSQTFLPVLLMVFAFALLASLLLLPIFPDLFVSTFNVMVPFLLFGSTFFLVQFRVLGDITHERYAGSVLDEMTWKRIMASSLVFSLIGICFSRFLRTFMHRYYSRSLHLAFYAGGKNCNWSAVRKNPYCPLLLLNAAVNDYLRLVDTEPISDITFSQLHTGGQRVGYFWAFGARPLARTAALSGGAIDGFIMSKYDSVSLRFWLEFLGVYMGDFVHIARTAGPGLRFRAWLQRLPTLLWWQLIYGLLLAATILSMHPSLDRCSIAFRLCQWSALLAAGLAGLSFFSFLPFLGFLQHSPLLRTLQQATRFYYQSPQPPGTVYISDGGVVDNTGVLSLLRRRCRRILAVYAGEEAQGKELKCIKKLLMHMHEDFEWAAFLDPGAIEVQIRFQTFESKEEAFRPVCERMKIPKCRLLAVAAAVTWLVGNGVAMNDAGNLSQANSILSLGACSMQPGRAIADFDGSNYGREFISFARGDEVHLISSPQTNGADGWSVGYLQKDGATGLFPASYWNSGASLTPARTESAPQVGVALADFDGTHYGSDFMSFSLGDDLTVLQVVGRGSGWSYGIRHRDASKGLFPTTYCALKRLQQDAPTGSACGQQLTIQRHGPHHPEAPDKLLGKQGATAGTFHAAVRPSEAAFQEPVMIPATRLQNRMQLSGEAAVVPGNILSCAGHAAPAASSSPVPAAQPKPSEEEKAQAWAVTKVLQAVGGKAPLTNACTALLALGIMQGPHQNACKNVVTLVQSRHDLFVQLPKHWRMISQKDLIISLKPSALAASSKVSR